LDFPTTSGAYQTSFPGGNSAYAAKFDAAGSLVYSTYLGGGLSDTGQGIAVDASGNVYVTGNTAGNFPTTSVAYQTIYGGGGDIFVMKLNAAGSALLYSTYLGGIGGEASAGIAVDASGDAYVTGTTTGNFPTTSGAYQTSYGGSGDEFVTKLDPTGATLVYSTYLGGANSDMSSFGNGIAVDSSGNAYISGTTFGSFPTTPGSYRPTSGGGTDDVFVSKLNASGSALVYSTYLGGSSFDIDDGIAVDAYGNVFVTGYTGSANFPTTSGAYQTTLNGIQNGFVTELNSAGNALVYSTYLGGGANGHCQGIAVDAYGNIFVTGQAGAGFPTTGGAYQTVFGGNNGDAFVTKFGYPFPTPTPTVTSTPTQSPTFTATPFPTSTVTPTPTASIILSCQNPLFISRNRYSPKSDFPRLFARVIQCAAGHFSVMVYNSAGEHIRTLVDDSYRSLGTYEVEWDGKNMNGFYVASGVYLVCFTEPKEVHKAKVLVIR
jgi:hypothetical protein